MSDQRIGCFPMQDGPDIEWSTAQQIYEIYSELYGTEQSLERLKERGGFGWAEVALMVKKRDKRNCKFIGKIGL